MKSQVKVSTIYHCSLERAFKTPMLCDITKIHTGFGFTPRVTHSSEDANWGKSGFDKKIFTAPTFLQKGGWSSNDKVIERIENEYWKIEVSNFQFQMYGFTQFIGEWKTTELEPNKILIDYSYELHSNNIILYPFNWIFAKTFWRIYMNRVLENIRKMIDNKEPYIFD